MVAHAVLLFNIFAMPFRSNPFRGRVDELKLCLRFDVDSRQLPNKIQLEVTDPKTGRYFFSF